MVLIEILVALLVSAVLTIVLIAVFRWQRPGAKGYWSSALYLFALLFVANWAGGVWLSPFGPVAWGSYWVPFVITGLVVAVLLLFIVPNRRPRSTEEAQTQAAVQAGAPGISSASCCGSSSRRLRSRWQPTT